MDAVAPINARMPTALSLGMADPMTMQAALDSLEDQGAREIAVVRLFLSGDSFLHPTEFMLGLRPDAPEIPAAVVRDAQGRGEHVMD
jgi:hypothetical protein